MLFLGIETSCDETAAAVVSDDRAILSNVVLTQLEEHKPFGGVVPEIAARSHLQNLPKIIKSALADAELTFADLDGVAATAGPGLIGGVMVGLMAAKSIALVHQLPFCAITAKVPAHSGPGAARNICNIVNPASSTISTHSDSLCMAMGVPTFSDQPWQASFSL